MGRKINVVAQDAKRRKQILLEFVAFANDVYAGDIAECILDEGNEEKLQGHPLYEDALEVKENPASIDRFLRLFWRAEQIARPSVKYPQAMATWLKKAYTVFLLTLTEIAKILGKTVQSVRMKLVKMHLYGKPA